VTVPPASPTSTPPHPLRINPTVDRLAAYSWRLLVIAAALLAGLLLLVELRLVLFPVIVATFLTVALSPVARLLAGFGLPRLLATALAFLLFFGGLAGIIALIVPTVADEFGDIGPTVSEAVDSIETWLIDDLGVAPAQLEEWRDQATSTARKSAGGSTSAIVGGAVVVGETLAGLLLSLFLAFFMVKDGERFQAFVLRLLPHDRRALARRLGARGWRTLGGYLRGSAALGVVESIIIGIAMALTGAALVPAVMTITFLAAFVPFVGAIVAGTLAVAVTLVTGGVGAAAVVAVVALVVQQLDNDLLAPVVFGKTLELHPVAILLGVATGAAVGGLPGAVLAVPVTALIANLTNEVRHPRGDDAVEPQPS
jgi:predicted PurR-regulated permease PerM